MNSALKCDKIDAALEGKHKLMISPTIKLYDEDAYATEFDAVVVKSEVITEGEYKGARKILLDRTAFFPEEGGQEADFGTLNGAQVLDVQIEKRSEGELIFHTVCADLEEGDEVAGVVDWDHRFDQMQQHSGEHIFSGTVHNEYGYDNVGFHLSRQVVTMDFNGPLDDAQVLEIERKVNEVIIKNLEIEISWPSKEELDKLDYRSKKELEGDVRIVTIPGVDVCACCAPHVRRTGEIGFLKVLGRQNYKGGVRIFIECGLRALNTLGREHTLIQDLAGYLTTSIDSVPGQVSKLKDELYEVKGSLQKAKAELLSYKLREIPKDQKNVTIFTQDMDNKSIQNAINEFTESHEGFCSFFVTTDSGYRFVSGISNGDARKVAAALKQKFGAKGGGSDKMVQGSMPGAPQDEIRKIIDEIED